MKYETDIAVVGAGAAGLMAAIWAGRTAPNMRVTAIDGARKLGAKILVSGGGRCNVTHFAVSADDFAGSTRPAIAKVLRRFDVPQTVAFFSQLGVILKQEETGKLFPTTDSASTILYALMHASRDAGVTIAHPKKVDQISRKKGGYTISGDWGTLTSAKVILAAGGKSLPKSGSDGSGFALAQSLGHTITPRLLPSLVALTLPKPHLLRQLSGIALPASLSLYASSGKLLKRFEDSLLCTHFGISGPAAMNISRFYLDAVADDPGASLTVNWLPQMSPEAFERSLLDLKGMLPYTFLRTLLPDRMASAFITEAGAEGKDLTREQRKALVDLVTRSILPIAGHRGFNYAEATAGGVPLQELNLKSMESRRSPGLYLCGEILDVDGRIGGFNFQWAWASGYLAGISAAEAAASQS